MTERRAVSLVRYFLKNSPYNQLKKTQKIFPHSKKGITPISNRAYLQGFLKSVEVFGTPISELKLYEEAAQINANKFFKRERTPLRIYEKAHSESEQLSNCVKKMTAPTSVSLNAYQQLEQRIVIAKPDSIKEVRQKLIYLFKILINKRDKLPPGSLELDANLQLTEVIVKAFSRNHEFGENNKEWNNLQAMDKLMRARQYKKKGYSEIATNSFEQIFRDQQAAYKVRLQALKNLCTHGEEQGDVSKLEPLVSFTHEKGEQEYEEYLKIIIEKIKREEPKLQVERND